MLARRGDSKKISYGGIHEKWRESGGKMDERDEDGGRTMTMCDVAKNNDVGKL